MKLFLNDFIDFTRADSVHLEENTLSYRLDDDPNVASVLRLVSTEKYAQAKQKVGRTTARKLYNDLIEPLTEDERARLEQMTMPVLRNQFKLRHEHVPERILTPALLLYVLEQLVDREASR
jgi:hypothetical protein